MTSRPSRLALALQQAAIEQPSSVAAFNVEDVLPAFSPDTVSIEQSFRPPYDRLQALGYRVETQLAGRFEIALVSLPRAKAAARDLVARAAAVTEGLVFVDGQKTDGIDSLYTALRKKTEVAGTLTKAHGRCFWFQGGVDLSDWRAAPLHPAPGFQTRAGVFSADKVDRGSVLLAEAFGHTLKGRVADLGAGWGFLSAQALRSEAVTHLDGVEADHRAVACAQLNVADPRAQFHWADATLWEVEPYDAVVMNPPFHTGRDGDPGLGQAFIQRAAHLLKPGGVLWMVANRHLPYEDTLKARFARYEEVAGDGGFKVFRASRPRSRG